MQGKKIVIASDHAGFTLKEHLQHYLESKGYTVLDFGPADNDTPIDYPDKAYLVAKGIYRHEADIGILICGSGIGMSIAVNRYDFIRGALVYSAETAELARRHNNANVLVLGGRLTDSEDAKKYVDIFLTTPFEGGRHETRVQELGESNHDFEK